jgi:hypothetical protein
MSKTPFSLRRRYPVSGDEKRPEWLGVIRTRDLNGYVLGIDEPIER